MRQGVGVGMHLPYDPKYAGAYMPIVQRQIYCGNQDILPAGYDRIGNLPQCRSKGVGIGKRQRAEQGPPPRSSKVLLYVIPTAICILFAIALFLGFFFGKPSIVTKDDKDGRKEIDWGKFMTNYVIIVAVFSIIVVITTYLFTRYRQN